MKAPIEPMSHEHLVFSLLQAGSLKASTLADWTELSLTLVILPTLGWLASEGYVVCDWGLNWSATS